MKVDFRTFNGQQMQIEIDDNFSVFMVKQVLANLIKTDAVIKPEQIRLYCGNDKLKDDENFLKNLDTNTQAVQIRVVPIKVTPKQTEDSFGKYSFFKQLHAAFASSKLALHPIDSERLQQGKDKLLTTGAIPKDAMAVRAQGATITTDLHGTIIDLSGQTLNCILGLNDAWVSLREIAYKLSDGPQFCTIRTGSEFYYSYPQRLQKLLAAEGMTDYVINHRQCNGSDAVELAVHAAFRVHKDRKKIAAFKGSYHGQNLLATVVSEHQPSRFLVEQPSQVEFFPVPSYDTPALREQTEQSLNRLREQATEFAAILIEPLQVRNAVHECPIEFLKALRDICDESGTCLIFDEIQTGFGWLGTLTFSGSHGVRPDIGVFSKAVTSGYGALAIMVAHEKYRNVSSTFSGKTNSGTQLTLVAADAVLDRLCGIEAAEIPKWLPDNLQEELKTGLMKKVPEISERLIHFLEKLKEFFPDMTGRIKGQGIVRGLEILSSGEPNEKLCAWLINKAYGNGVYLRQAEHVIIFKPALVITDEEFATALERLSKTFQEGKEYDLECKANNKTFMVGQSHG